MVILCDHRARLSATGALCQGIACTVVNEFDHRARLSAAGVLCQGIVCTVVSEFDHRAHGVSNQERVL